MALSASSPRKSDEDKSLSFHPMAAVVAYQGGLAVLDSTGYVKPGVAASSLTSVGIFDFTADVMEGQLDNSGGNPGDLYARIRRGTFCFKNKSGDLVVQADVGKFCYIYDDDTVCHTGTSKSVAGIVRRVDSDGVWVRVGAELGEALASEISAREAISTALALATTPGGASLVGIFDTADKFVATTVEAALAEGIAGKRIAATANDAAVGGVSIVHTIAIADAASATKTVTLHATYGAIKILEVHFIKAGTTGGSTDSIKLTDGNHDITDAMDLNTKAAGVITRAASISPTYGSLAAGATLVANWTKTTNGCEGTLVIIGVRA